MTLNSVDGKVIDTAKLFVTNIDKLKDGMDTPIKEFGLDSLDHLDFLINLEEDFKIDLEEFEDAVEEMTVNDVIKRVKEKIVARDIDKPERSGI